MSADIRNAGYKISSIDANLYPAGFNNLDGSYSDLAAAELRKALENSQVPAGSNLLLVSEEHTRNLFYLENIHALKSLLEKAGYSVEASTQFLVEGVDYTDGFLSLQSATGKEVQLLSPERAQEKLSSFQAIIMNHDSSAGSAEWIQNAAIPVLPPWQAGWHYRSKACHFFHYRELIEEASIIIGVDPWFLAPLYRAISDVDINADQSREAIATQADHLLTEIAAKYKEHGIDEKPFVFLKSDHGTYGMAMLSFESSREIVDLNRKEKNKLFKGKSSVVVKDYLLQEGIPTVRKMENHFAENVVMLSGNRFIGTFARANEQKDARTSLNSTGMYFKKIPLADSANDATRVAVLVTRIAGIALQREIEELVAGARPRMSVPATHP